MTSLDNIRTPPILDDYDDTEEEDDQDPSASLNSDPVGSVSIAVPPRIVDDLPESAPKRQRTADDDPEPEPEPPVRVVSVSSPSQQQLGTGDDQARKLFQRLWTDEDEIGLLQGFLDYSTQRGTSQNNPHDTSLFYDHIKSKLQLDFNKSQLVEKLRRLKKKYRNVLARVTSGKEISFKSPHDQATFEIATKIWGTNHTTNSSHKGHHVHQHRHQNNLHHQQQQMLQRRIDVDDDMPPNFNPAKTNLNLNFASQFNSSHHSDRVADERKSQHKSSKKRNRERNEVLMDHMGAAAVPAGSTHVQIPVWPPGIGLSTPVMAEEKAKNKTSPMFRDMYDRSGGGSRGFVDGIVNRVPLSFASPTINMFGGMEITDDRWRNQQILELEVYSKRLELVQEQINLTLEQLRSKGS